MPIIRNQPHHVFGRMVVEHSAHARAKAKHKRDGRDDYLSPRRAYRREVERELGKLSGRQWKKYYKAAQRADRAAA